MKNFTIGLAVGIVLGLTLFVGGAAAYKYATTFDAGSATMPIEDIKG